MTSTPHVAARAAFIALLGMPLCLHASVPDTVRAQSALADSGAAAVSASLGSSFICVVRPSGRTQCWGDNTEGQLGIGRVGGIIPGPAATAILPADSASRIVSVALGNDFACALNARGGIVCWGANEYGQLGDGTTRRRTRPVAVKSGETFSAVALGEGYSCALTREGRAFCWGKNDDPATLGTGDSTERHVPTPVATSLRFSRLSVGREGSTCGIARDSLAYCWGLGIRAAQPDTVFLRPTLVSARVKFRDVGVGDLYACGVTFGDDLYCWGQFAYGDATLSSAPTNPWPGGRKFASISTSGFNLCGITTAQQLLCWGNNTFGLVGNGRVDTVTVRTPTPILPSTRFRSVSVGSGGACAISAANQLYCWGNGVHGAGGYLQVPRNGSQPERF